MKFLFSELNKLEFVEVYYDRHWFNHSIYIWMLNNILHFERLQKRENYKKELCNSHYP